MKDSTNGRLKLTFISWAVDLAESYWHQYLSSSSSFLRLAAFCLSSTGAYVSLTVVIKMTAAPVRINTNQLSQRHPRYWYTKPPINGPVTGPFRGAMLHRLTVSRLPVSNLFDLTKWGEEFVSKFARAVSGGPNVSGT